MQSEIPDKLYFKIGEVSKLADVAPHVLRYWESEFKEIRPKRANSKQRLYRYADVEIILKIKTLLHERGYTISGARKFLASGEELEEPSSVSDLQDVSTFLGQIKKELLQVQDILNEKKEKKGSE
jgi:DNA-binding transcriptional MerR regulator